MACRFIGSTDMCLETAKGLAPAFDTISTNMNNSFNSGGLADDLGRSAALAPDKAALIHRGETVPYRELDRNADRVAAGLHRLGVRKGDRVAFAIGNRPAFVAVHYGVMRVGALSVPLDTRIKVSELRNFLLRVDPRAIISHESVVGGIMSAGPHSAPVFVIGKHPTARQFQEILSDSDPPRIEIAPGDPAIIAYTSGTSGIAKGVVLTHGNISSSIDQMIELPSTRLEPSDLIYAVMPLFYIYPLSAALGVAIRTGATLLLEEAFDPRLSMQSIAANGVTVIPGTPPMFTAWLSLPPDATFDLPMVRFAVSGGAALAPTVIARFRERFGVEIWEGYGLTETGSVVTTTRVAEQRPGSIGKPLPGQEVRIVDHGGEDVIVGDLGELWVRGPNVFHNYWNDTEASEEAFSDDWFRTGDIAYQDEEGYLWLVDRNQEVISVSGFKVYPVEVERVLMLHEAVADAAVVPKPDERQGQRVHAVVVLREGSYVGEKDLIVHCTRHLARFKVPATIEFATELPHLESGRVLKRMLGSSESAT